MRPPEGQQKTVLTAFLWCHSVVHQGTLLWDQKGKLQGLNYGNATVFLHKFNLKCVTSPHTDCVLGTNLVLHQNRQKHLKK